MTTRECDLIIVGAGPAGFSAAINGASEGLKIILIDSGPSLGGQARQSSLIENYPGFPEGISGPDLIDLLHRQTRKFNAQIECPQVASSLELDGRHRVITTKAGDLFVSRMAILSGGLSYRKLDAKGVPDLMGKGVVYGAPTCDPLKLGSCDICIVGGANSAGQAAMHLSRNPEARIRLLIRKGLADQMSTYLVERIRVTPNIEVIEGVEVSEVAGEHMLQSVQVRRFADGSFDHIDAAHLFIFIGAQPKVEWLDGSVAMDERKFIRTGTDLDADWKLARNPFGFETSMPGVFCAGDLRWNSTKRIAAAAGEGAVALQYCHGYSRTDE